MIKGRRMATGIPTIVLAVCMISASADAQPHRISRHPETGYSGSINRDALDSGLAAPTITGTFDGAGGVAIVIVSGDQTLPQRGSFANIPNTVLYGFSDHGGDIELDYSKNSFTSGTFSYTIDTLLKSGIYTVAEYVFGGGWSRSKLVASVRMMVR